MKVSATPPRIFLKTGCLEWLGVFPACRLQNRAALLYWSVSDEPRFALAISAAFVLSAVCCLLDFLLRRTVHRAVSVVEVLSTEKPHRVFEL